jgi:hypothetical protein
VQDGLHKVDAFFRAAIDGKVVVCRPGDRIPIDLAERLGLRPKPEPPRPPQGARTPPPTKGTTR